MDSVIFGAVVGFSLNMAGLSISERPFKFIGLVLLIAHWATK